MSNPILKVTGITKTFGGTYALDNVDLCIEKGEIHCLVGGNGSGKSTLIKIISGFYKPDSGVVEIDSKEYAKLNTIMSINAGIQVIYQDMSIFPNLTVAENIAINYNLSNNKKLVNWKQIKALATTAMEKIGVNLPLNELVENLSVADKQLIAIARAILYDAKLIIMDEPTTALTRKEINKLFEIIRNLQAKGVAVLFVSHKLDEVFEIASKFTVLRNGKKVITDDTKNVDHEKLVYYMTGRKFDVDYFTPTVDKDSEPLFKVENLSLKNGFENVSFEVRKGEVLGITGLLGSGRTELAKSLFGLYPATDGHIYIKGKEISVRSAQDAIKNKIAYVPEDRLTEGLFLLQPTKKNLVISNIKNMLKSNKTIDSELIDEDMKKWKEELSVVMGSAEDEIQTLSGGNQQKVVLAKWLETNPDVLILNGPTVGVDIGAKYDLHEYIRNIVKDGDMAVIIISDDIEEVLQNCNRILIMKRGRICDEVVNIDYTPTKLLNLVTEQA